MSHRGGVEIRRRTRALLGMAVAMSLGCQAWPEAPRDPASVPAGLPPARSVSSPSASVRTHAVPSTIREVTARYVERDPRHSRQLWVTDVPEAEEVEEPGSDDRETVTRGGGPTAARSPRSGAESRHPDRGLTRSFDAADFDLAGSASGYYSIPPDPNAAAGREHLVDAQNTVVQFHDKATGRGGFYSGIASFFADLEPQTITFDPKVIYDPYADRFLLLALERTGSSPTDPLDTSRLFLAVSDDGDPNGDWYLTSVNALTTVAGVKHWADFPGLAVDEEAIYVTANLQSFGPSPTFGGARLWVVAKGLSSNGFYDGGGAAVTKLDPYGGGGVATTTEPAAIRGDRAAGAGTLLVSYSGLTDGTNEHLQIVRIDDPLGTPTFTQQVVPLGNLEDLDGPLLPAPQAGGVTPIEIGDRRALAAVWRGESAWVTTTIRPRTGPDAGQTTAHWIRLDTSNPNAITVSDQGDIGAEELGAGTSTFHASVDANAKGVAALGFGASSPSIHPGSYWALRLPADAPGAATTTHPLREGVDSYVRTFGGANRWGDYSGASVDFDDDCFWIYNEHAGARGTPIAGEDGRWVTAYGRVCPDGPDLEVGTASASAGTVLPQTAFELSVPVENQGNETSEPTTLRYFRSLDPTIDPGDTELASLALAALSPGAVATPSVPVTAPSATGLYWFGACASTFAAEVSVANNCSEGVQVGVGAVPDWIIASFTTNSPSLPTGSKLTAYTHVINAGTVASPQTTVRYYESGNPAISTGDTLVAVGSLTALATGAAVDLTKLIDPASGSGTVWIGACVVTAGGELNAANNCSGGVAVQIGVKPDLEAYVMDLDPDVVNVGAHLTVTAQVMNSDFGAAAATTLRLFHSLDTVIGNGDDTLIGTLPVPSTLDGIPPPSVFETTAPSSAGSHYLGVCVDQVPFETAANNNCSGAEKLTVIAPPNLVTTTPSVSQTALGLAQPFTFRAKVSNSGVGNAQASTLRIFSSSDPTVTPADVQLGSAAVTALVAGGSQDVTKQVYAPSEAGQYYIGACVDPVLDENVTTDNCSTGVAVTSSRPSLAALAAPIRLGAALPIAGSGFTPGSVIQAFVASPAGVVAYGPFTPVTQTSTTLTWAVPGDIALGNGFASLVVVNADQGYVASEPVCQNLLGPLAGGPPSIEAIDGVALAEPDCASPVAFIPVVIEAGHPVTITGRGFSNPLDNLFTASGNLGPLSPAPGATQTSHQVTVPGNTPTGPGAIQVVDAPYTGNTGSNAVSVTLGAPLSITNVSQAGGAITVTGGGFSALSVVNLFNRQGQVVLNLGGLAGTTPRIPLSSVTPTSFQFQLPATAMPGPAYVQVLNPPFISATSTGNAPAGAIQLVAP